MSEPPSSDSGSKCSGSESKVPATPPPKRVSTTSLQPPIAPTLWQPAHEVPLRTGPKPSAASSTSSNAARPSVKHWSSSGDHPRIGIGSPKSPVATRLSASPLNGISHVTVRRCIGPTYVICRVLTQGPPGRADRPDAAVPHPGCPPAAAGTLCARQPWKRASLLALSGFYIASAPPPTIGQRSEPCSDKGRSPMAPAHERAACAGADLWTSSAPSTAVSLLSVSTTFPPGLFTSIPPGRTDGVGLPTSSNGSSAASSAAGFSSMAPCGVRCDDCAFERLVPLSCKGRAAARELMLSSCRCHPNRFRDGAPPPGLRFVGCRCGLRA